MHLYSSNNELAIAGSLTELNQLANIILKLKNGENHCITASLDTRAEPYETLLNKISLQCNQSKIKCSVSNKALILEFPEKTKKIVASYFSCFTNDSTAGDHYHFDKIGNEKIFDNESIAVVIQYGS